MRWGLKGRRPANDTDERGSAGDVERPARPARDELAVLMTAPNEPMAHYWSDILGEAGIKTMIRPGGAGIGAWGSASTLEHDILVLTSQVDEARQIVVQADGDESDQDEL